MSVYECPSGPCPSPEKAKGCIDCQCEQCPNPDNHEGGQGVIPEQERAYEEELRGLIRVHRQQEEYSKSQRQGLEARLQTLLAKRGLQRLQDGCPPAFAYDCVLEDGTRCQFDHEGQCVKAEEETA